MCMGRTHVAMGASIWLAAAPVLASEVARPMAAGELVASTFAAAGAALLPDLDHPSATLARTVGPVTRGLSRVVAGLAGGHRRGTHSVVFCVLAGGLAALVVVAGGRAAAAGVFFALAYVAMVALGVNVGRGTSLGDGVLVVQAAAATAAAWVVLPPVWWWLPWSVAGGCVVHLVGDVLTDGGVPLAWPFSDRRVAVPLLGETGGWVESVAAAGAFTAFLLWVAAAALVGAPWWTAAWLS